MQLHTWLQRQAEHLRPLSRRLVSHLQGLSHVFKLCCYCALWQRLWSLTVPGAKIRLPAPPSMPIFMPHQIWDVLANCLDENVTIACFCRLHMEQYPGKAGCAQAG